MIATVSKKLALSKEHMIVGRVVITHIPGYFVAAETNLLNFLIVLEAAIGRRTRIFG
jgi:hypothetical protein